MEHQTVSDHLARARKLVELARQDIEQAQERTERAQRGWLDAQEAVQYWERIAELVEAADDRQDI